MSESLLTCVIAFAVALYLTKLILPLFNNITNKQSFFFENAWSSKYNKETKEYIYVKRAIYPKDEIIFNFIIYSSNDELLVIDNFLLGILKIEITSYSNINNIIIEVKFELVKKLLKEANIEGFNFSYLLDPSPDIFLLNI